MDKCLAIKKNLSLCRVTPYPLTNFIQTIPAMKTIFLSSVVWLLSAHVCHAEALSRELTELDAQIQDMRSDLPYQTGDMVWQDVYREGK